MRRCLALLAAGVCFGAVPPASAQPDLPVCILVDWTVTPPRVAIRERCPA